MSLFGVLFARRFENLIACFSVGYLFMFLPAALLVYALVPQRARRGVLLLTSYLFYWLVSGQLVVYLLFSTLSMHHFGLWIDRLHDARDAALDAAPRPERKALRKLWKRRVNAVAALAVVLHIGTLLLLKYSGFFLGNVNALLEAVGVSARFKIPVFLQPLGISFFTLQALAYILDVCRGMRRADDNALRLALFMAFFPQIVEGPICRYEDTAQRLWEAPPVRFDNLKWGGERVLYGMMKKVVVADRLNQMVGVIFHQPEALAGGWMALGAVCYTVQLYMDFSGSMDCVCGVAQMYGITMPENFKRPFFARTISEFWQRWHVTLGAWLRDYLFYPVSTSAPMKALTLSARKKLGNHYGPLAAGSVALLCVWLCNGLWHGAGWNYIFFGMYHFVLILAGSLIAPPVRAFNERRNIDSNGRVYRILQTLRTCALVAFGELFFRAEGLKKGLYMAGKMFTDFGFAITGSLENRMNIDGKDFGIALVTLAIVFCVSLANEKGRGVRAWLDERPRAVRWALLYALMLYIIIFGAYGHDYEAVIPLYANF